MTTQQIEGLKRLEGEIASLKNLKVTLTQWFKCKSITLQVTMEIESLNGNMTREHTPFYYLQRTPNMGDITLDNQNELLALIDKQIEEKEKQITEL